jgi:hypothetical protein
MNVHIVHGNIRAPWPGDAAEWRRHYRFCLCAAYRKSNEKWAPIRTNSGVLSPVEKVAAVNAVYTRYFPGVPPPRIFICVVAWGGPV